MTIIIAILAVLVWAAVPYTVSGGTA